MTHTVDTLMELAYKIRDARTYEWDVSEVVDADKKLRAALAELVQAAPVQDEPVAWLSIDSIGERYLCFSKPRDNDQVHALYATPRTSAEQDEPVYGNVKSSAGLIHDGLVDYIIKFYFVAPKGTT